MIWIWASAAIVIAMIMFHRQRIPWYHFIWVLLPINQYGFFIGGATIKPYMLFIIPLLFIAAYKHKLIVNKNQIAFIVLFIFLFLLSDLTNGLPVSSILQRIYFLIILIEAWVYSCFLFTEKDYNDVIKSILISIIAFGCVYLFAEVSFISGVFLPGAASDSTTYGSLIKLYSTMNNGALLSIYRLHGFESDPNAFCIMQLCGLAIASYNLLIIKRHFILNTIALAFAGICIFFSGSRSGMLTGIFIFILIVIFKLRGKKAAMIIGIPLLLVSFIAIVMNFNDLQSAVIALFERSGRSSPVGDYGRVTIWIENIGNMLRINPIFGIGANRSWQYSSILRACHNTWIEWLCSTGIIGGVIGAGLFISPVFKCRKILLTRDGNTKHIGSAFYYSYLAIVIMLITIDYFANTYLLFLFIIQYRYRRNFFNRIGSEQYSKELVI